jgi:hypothetical protein
MTYDNTDSNADGTVDAEVDNSLIDTANGELKGDVDVKSNDINGVGGIQASSVFGDITSNVYAIGESGIIDVVDPSTTTTPVTDAANSLINNTPLPGWGGQVILPPQIVQNDATIPEMKNGTITSLGAWGSFRTVSNSGPAVQFTSDVEGLVLGDNFGINGGLKLIGPGATTGTKPAITTNGQVGTGNADRIFTQDWGGPSFYPNNGNTGESFFFVNVGQWYAYRHNPARHGQTDFILKLGQGVSNTINHCIIHNGFTDGTTLSSVPQALRSQSVLKINGMEFFGQVGSNSTTSSAALGMGAHTHIGYLSIEEGPDPAKSPTIGTVAQIGGSTASIRAIQVAEGRDVDRFYNLARFGSGGIKGGYLQKPIQTGSGSITTPLEVFTVPDEPIQYSGERASLTDSTDTTGWAAGIDCADQYYKP